MQNLEIEQLFEFTNLLKICRFIKERLTLLLKIHQIAPFWYIKSRFSSSFANTASMIIILVSWFTGFLYFVLYFDP